MVPSPRAAQVLALSIVILFFLYFAFDSRIRPRTSALVPLTEPASQIHNATTPTASTPVRILIVSALFLLSNSRHSSSDLAWLSQFLQSITTDIYFFTTPELEPIVRRVRGDLPITINTSFSSPFDIPPLAGLQPQYDAMRDQDHEKPRHSSERYAVRNAKPYFLDEAIKHSDRAYDYAFWNDAGGFRTRHVYAGWPDSVRIEEIWENGRLVSRTNKEDLLFFPIRGVPHSSFKYWNEALGPVDNEFSDSSFFGGTPRMVEWWRHVFYTYHDYYLSLGLFVGKDRALINALFLLFPSRIITVWLDDPNAPAHIDLLPLTDESALGSCGTERRYYQWWMASAGERAGMRGIFDWDARWRWPWWRTRKSCRLTRVLGMQSVLERPFGDGWTAPGRTLALDE